MTAQRFRLGVEHREDLVCHGLPQVDRHLGGIGMQVPARVPSAVEASKAVCRSDSGIRIISLSFSSPTQSGQSFVRRRRNTGKSARVASFVIPSSPFSLRLFFRRTNSFSFGSVRGRDPG